MRNLQKQMCGIAVLIFGLILAVIGLEFGDLLGLIGGIVGLLGLGMTFWNKDGTEETGGAEES